MTDTYTPPTRPSAGRGLSLPQRSMGLKLLLVCALALLMAIPALFVFSVVYDRSSRADAALSEVSERYGGRQTVMGPALLVPYAQTYQDGDELRTRYGQAVAYAETGEISAQTQTEIKTRGIHEIPVYTADVSFEGLFDPQRLRDAIPMGAEVDWSGARIYLSISDTRGTNRPTQLVANGETLEVEPAGGSRNTYGSDKSTIYGTHNLGIRLAASYPDLETREAPLTITANMAFSGADRLAFAPFARNTTVSLTSDWEDPSFDGGFQYASYENDPSTPGFTAGWNVPYEARGIPGAGQNLSFDDILRDNAVMSVRLVTNASPYQSVQRALKYALMFIGFVFLAYFLFEVTSGQRAHPAQYVLVGLAQAVFYLMLLAIAEQVGFDGAFFLAAIMTVLLTSGYAASVFRSRTYGMRALGILTGVYALIYVLMRLEDFALLVGALASFAAIAGTMWMTRNIDWYGMTHSAADTD